ncbi:hypothetical protein D3C71_1305800 [compost metagenome]
MAMNRLEKNRKKSKNLAFSFTFVIPFKGEPSNVKNRMMQNAGKSALSFCESFCELYHTPLYHDREGKGLRTTGKKNLRLQGVP